MARPNAAIQFDAASFSTAGAKLMGRQSAGEGLLRGYVRHAGVRPLYGRCTTSAEAEAFQRVCREFGAEEGAAQVLRGDGLEALREVGTLYMSGPCLGEMAWRRARIGANAFSLCGITHTIASLRAMDCLAECQTAPVEPWDALICTSRAVQDAVRRLFEANAEYLRGRFGAREVPQPELPMIPLGVHCDAFAPDAAARARWRERLAIGGEDVAFLFFGRLSFHAKANPLPMLVALERAAAQARVKLHLVLTGWFSNDMIAREFREAVRQFCPSVNTHFVDGRADDAPSIWHAADVFTSLSDNIQESFGLTPVEAMASGLPCVVSDWDGYRDTVRDGVDGMRIPTLAPATPAGETLIARHENGADSYDRYIGYASQFVAVDTEACATAYARLAGDASLRRAMGAAGRQRAREEFDWAVIVRRYQALWMELAARRVAAPSPAARSDPRRTDPFWMFESYASAILDARSEVALAHGASLERLDELRNAPLVSYARPVHPPRELCVRLLDRLAKQPCATDVLRTEGDAAAVDRAIVWLHKLGLLTVRVHR
jgi:starch synthase